jgi:hypothetical protein
MADVKQRQVEAEAKVVEEVLQQLEAAIVSLNFKKAGKHQSDCLEQTVKLAHQLRSLIGAPEAK